MSTINSGPNIVYDGLRMYLDAANIKSYPGSGSTWFDLSNNNNNGTLSNTTFDSEVGGCFSFNGSSSYVNLNGGSALNNWDVDARVVYSLPSYTSACFWFKTNTVSGTGLLLTDSFGPEYGVRRSGSNIQGVCYGSASTAISANIWYYVCLTALNRTPNTGSYTGDGTNATVTTTYPIPFSSGSTVGWNVNNVSQGNRVTTVTGTSTCTFSLGGTGPVGTFNCLFSTSQNQGTAKVYLNGEYKAIASGNISNGANDPPFNIGRDGGALTNYFSGKIASCKLYDRRLTDEEVLQNYNATKKRFGL